MKKLLFIALASICMGAMLTACTGKTAAVKHTEVDTVWNNHIQKTFFGVSFGASQKEVIKAFSKQGLYDNSFIRTKNALYYPSCSFGGFDWQMINVYFSNGKFNGIQFYNAYKDKASAMNAYENLKETVGQKYQFTEREIKDTTCYAASQAFGKDGRVLAIICDKSESKSKELLIYVQLGYADFNIEDKVSSEL